MRYKRSKVIPTEPCRECLEFDKCFLLYSLLLLESFLRQKLVEFSRSKVRKSTIPPFPVRGLRFPAAARSSLSEVRPVAF